MPYVSFSLKYRPRCFDDVIGQQHVAKTLKNALANDRVAHAYLFTGPRGTGKTSTARILAAALNCEHGPTAEPCGECTMCKAIIAGNAMDVKEIDAASNNSVDDIRDLRDKVQFAPAEGRYKIYILDEAHMLSNAAVNALLKTLEEPPKHVVFLLLTTEAHQILPTIVSRCQHFDFRGITLADIAGALRRIANFEGLEVDDAALMAIAFAADGAMRDAQSIFDQIVAYSDGAINLATVNEVLGVTDQTLLSAIVDQVIASDVAATFSSVDRAISEGKDLVRLVEDLTVYLRDLLRISVAGPSVQGLRMSAEATEQMQQQAHTFGSTRLLSAVKSLAELQAELRHTSQHSLLVEVALAQLCRAQLASQQLPQSSSPTETPNKQVIPNTLGAGESNLNLQRRPNPTEPASSELASTPISTPTLSADEELTLATLETHWETVYQHLRQSGHTPIQAMLCSGTPTKFENDIVTLCFAASAEFHYDKVRTDYKDIVEEALTQTFGRQIAIICMIGEDKMTQNACALQPSAPQCPEGQMTNQFTSPATVPVSFPPTVCTVEPSSEILRDDLQPAVNATEQDDKTPLTPEQCVAQTLRLFEGSTEISTEEDPE